MTPQGQKPIDYDALAAQARQAPPPPAVDYDKLAEEARKAPAGPDQRSPLRRVVDLVATVAGISQPGMEGTTAADVTGAAPMALGAFGGMVGGLTGGPLAAVKGAALGGGAGESVREHLNRLIGLEAPGTPLDAAKAIAGEGAVQGAAEAVGGVAGRGMQWAARRLMQSAVKPTLKMIQAEYSTRAPELVKTLLDNGITVTKRGLSKLEGLLAMTNDEIKQALEGSTATIQPARVVARVEAQAAERGVQALPEKDLAAMRGAVEEFMTQSHTTQPGVVGTREVPSTILDASGRPAAVRTEPIMGRVSRDIPVQEAQALKQGTYRSLAGKYGPKSSEDAAAIEAEKALARGLKEEIAAAVPQVSGLNAREGRLLAAKEAVARRVALSGNANPIGFAWVTHHPAAFVAALMDRSPAVKSYIARGLWDHAAKAAGVSPQLVRAAVKILAEQPDDKEP